jgi:hypothetical protein
VIEQRMDVLERPPQAPGSEAVQEFKISLNGVVARMRERESQQFERQGWAAGERSSRLPPPMRPDQMEEIDAIRVL